MSFLNPIFFWAAALILPLAAVYFLKVKPRVDTTTAFFLWKKIYHEKRSSSLFNRLRDLLSLLLMVFVFLLLTVAMTGPEFVSQNRQDLLIVIDNSASMAAGAGSTRLNKAKSKAVDIISALTPGRRAAIASTAGRTQYHSYLSDNIRHLRRAIDSITQTDVPFNTAALEKTTASVNANQDSRVILISDASAFRTTAEPAESPTAPPLPLLPSSVELVKIESDAVNVGIVECDLQEIAAENSRMTLYYRLANAGTETIQADFLLYRIDNDNADPTTKPLTRLEKIAIPRTTSLKLIKAIPVEIAPGVNEASFFYLADAQPGRWLAVLDYEDALPVDNIAYLNVESPEPIHINVITENRYFFEHCVQAFAQSSSLLRLSSGPAAGQPTDVFLAEGSIPPAHQDSSVTEKKATVLFNPSGKSNYWSAVGRPLAPDSMVVRVLADDDPALAYYDVSTIPFFGAKYIEIPSDAQCLVETDTHIPLIWRLDRPEHDMLVVNMDPAQGDFYFSPYFPVMVYRLALALVGKEPLKTASYKTGRSAAVNAESNNSVIAVSDPLGTSETVTGSQSIGPLETTGYYKIDTGDGPRYIAGSLLCKNETLLNNPQAVTNIGPIRKGHSPSYWLIAAALAIVAAESILYHRRKVG